MRGQYARAGSRIIASENVVKFTRPRERCDGRSFRSATLILGTLGPNDDRREEDLRYVV
jgi:hypothetical protein